MKTDAIVLTKEKTDIKSYATLSYVCGPYACNCENDCYKCREYIYKGLKKSLPKAVKVLAVINKGKSEESKINYLWIDQLCIDQKNLKEKGEEVRKMYQYYDNSDVTLISINANAKDGKVTEENKKEFAMETLKKIINSK